jgi:YbbR domain-containing protein
MLRRAAALVTHNFVWKTLSVGAAIMLWVALVDSPELTTSIPVSIEFRNYPRGLDIGTQSVDRVQLLVRGPREALAASNFDRTAAVIDLSAIQQPAERTFDIGRNVVGLPARVTLVQAVPSQLRLSLERHVSREVPVRLPRPPDGVRYGNAELKPDRVTISGPESQVKQVEYVLTDPLDSGTIEGSGEDKPIQAKLNTFVDNPRVRIGSGSSVSVRVVLERIRD